MPAFPSEISGSNTLPWRISNGHPGGGQGGIFWNHTIHNAYNVMPYVTCFNTHHHFDSYVYTWNSDMFSVFPLQVPKQPSLLEQLFNNEAQN